MNWERILGSHLGVTCTPLQSGNRPIYVFSDIESLESETVRRGKVFGVWWTSRVFIRFEKLLSILFEVYKTYTIGDGYYLYGGDRLVLTKHYTEGIGYTEKSNLLLKRHLRRCRGVNYSKMRQDPWRIRDPIPHLFCIWGGSISVYYSINIIFHWPRHYSLYGPTSVLGYDTKDLLHSIFTVLPVFLTSSDSSLHHPPPIAFHLPPVGLSPFLCTFSVYRSSGSFLHTERTW